MALTVADFQEPDNIGRRCMMGCATWPDSGTYSECPVCREPTRRFRGVKPMDFYDAVKAAKQAAFDHFYEEEWVQNLDPLTDDELLAMGISTDMQGLPVDPPGRVPPVPNSATIRSLPHRTSRRPSTSASAT